jgi:hypothetical protein
VSGLAQQHLHLESPEKSSRMAERRSNRASMMVGSRAHALGSALLSNYRGGRDEPYTKFRTLSLAIA